MKLTRQRRGEQPEYNYQDLSMTRKRRRQTKGNLNDSLHLIRSQQVTNAITTIKEAAQQNPDMTVDEITAMAEETGDQNLQIALSVVGTPTIFNALLAIKEQLSSTVASSTEVANSFLSFVGNLGPVGAIVEYYGKRATGGLVDMVDNPVGFGIGMLAAPIGAAIGTRLGESAGRALYDYSPNIIGGASQFLGMGSKMAGLGGATLGAMSGADGAYRLASSHATDILQGGKKMSQNVYAKLTSKASNPAPLITLVKPKAPGPNLYNQVYKGVPDYESLRNKKRGKHLTDHSKGFAQAMKIAPHVADSNPLRSEGVLPGSDGEITVKNKIKKLLDKAAANPYVSAAGKLGVQQLGMYALSQYMGLKTAADSVSNGPTSGPFREVADYIAATASGTNQGVPMPSIEAFTIVNNAMSGKTSGLDSISSSLVKTGSNGLLLPFTYVKSMLTHLSTFARGTQALPPPPPALVIPPSAIQAAATSSAGQLLQSIGNSLAGAFTFISSAALANPVLTGSLALAGGIYAAGSVYNNYKNKAKASLQDRQQLQKLEEENRIFKVRSQNPLLTRALATTNDFQGAQKVMMQNQPKLQALDEIRRTGGLMAQVSYTKDQSHLTARQKLRGDFNGGLAALHAQHRGQTLEHFNTYQLEHAKHAPHERDMASKTVAEAIVVSSGAAKQATEAMEDSLEGILDKLEHVLDNTSILNEGDLSSMLDTSISSIRDTSEYQKHVVNTAHELKVASGGGQLVIQHHFRDKQILEQQLDIARKEMELVRLRHLNSRGTMQVMFDNLKDMTNYVNPLKYFTFSGQNVPNDHLTATKATGEMNEPYRQGFSPFAIGYGSTGAIQGGYSAYDINNTGAKQASKLTTAVSVGDGYDYNVPKAWKAAKAAVLYRMNFKKQPLSESFHNLALNQLTYDNALTRSELREFTPNENFIKYLVNDPEVTSIVNQFVDMGGNNYASEQLGRASQYVSTNLQNLRLFMDDTGGSENDLDYRFTRKLFQGNSKDFNLSRADDPDALLQKMAKLQLLKPPEANPNKINYSLNSQPDDPAHKNALTPVEQPKVQAMPIPEPAPTSTIPKFEGFTHEGYFT